MQRPVILIVGAASGALLLAAAGASAHMGPLSKLVGTQSVTFGDEATGARVEPADTPEPTETPEAPATTQPAPAAETEEDVDNLEVDDPAQKITVQDAELQAATGNYAGNYARHQASMHSRSCRVTPAVSCSTATCAKR